MSECFHAEMAYERPIASMHPLMHLQRCFLYKALGAVGILTHPFPFRWRRVRFGVHGQLVRACEATLAYVTCERSVAAVVGCMTSQIALVIETTTALNKRESGEGAAKKTSPMSDSTDRGVRYSSACPPLTKLHMNRRLSECEGRCRNSCDTVSCSASQLMQTQLRK